MNEAMNEKRLSTADLVARAERTDEDVDRTAAQRLDEGPDERASERLTERMGERIDERVASAVPADGPQNPDDEPLEALFSTDAARDFRARWDSVQIGFVDDPARSVKMADELVAQVMSSLAETFASQRAELEQFVSSEERASTERMRVALRRYRSFFQRLLTL